MERGSGTRSGLLWEFERILKSCTERPQVLLMENVPEVCRGKNAAAFADWLSTLESLGYRNYYKIQNAVDYGIPQNRERCFMISLLGDYYYTFPEPAPLETCALDYLEERVPDRYYLTADDLETKLTYTYKDAKTVSGGGICKNAESERHERASVCIIPFCICAGKLQGHKYEKWLDIARRVYDAKGVCPTLTTVQSGGTEAKVVIRVKENTARGYSDFAIGGGFAISHIRTARPGGAESSEAASSRRRLQPGTREFARSDLKGAANDG